MGHPEQIKAFEKQIETSIDLQVDELRALDEKKSGTLNKLKKDILAQIKLTREDNPETPEKEEKYSEDLRLTEAELQSIFESIRTTHQKLFDENGIGDFYQFKILIGLSDPEITFAKSLLGIKLWGKKVELPLPLGINEEVASNYRKALEQVEKRTDLKPFITRSTRFIPRGGARLEFTIQKDGKEVKYSASPEALLRVDQEPSQAKIREWIQLSIQTNQLKAKLKGQIFRNPSFTNIPRDSLTKECFIRMLFDETKSMAVQEISDPRYLSNFSYEYRDAASNKTTTVEYISNIKRAITEKDPNNEQTATTITTFYSGGEIRSIQEIDSKNNTTREIRYRKDGSVESNRIENNEDAYDKKGENILYRRIWPENDGTVKNAMVAKDGSNFATLDVMREEKPHMSDREYLDYLAENLDTPEKLHLFFELFMRYVHDDAKLKDATYKTPNIGGSKDYWQTPEETIHRMEEGNMLGDCDDYAFLAKAILQRQEKTAYVIKIPDHAECIWIEKRQDGNWDAYSMGTFGLDKNGNRYGRTPDPEKEKGYPTIEEALNSLMIKYDEGGLGLENDAKAPYRIHDTVEILDIPESGHKTSNDIPVEILQNQKLVDMFITANSNMEVGAYGIAIKTYQSLILEDPLHRDECHKKLAQTLWKATQKEDLSGAVTVYSTFIDLYPDRPEYHAALGRIYIEARVFANDMRAEEQFKLAVEKGTTDENVFSKLATFSADRRDTNEEIRLLELAVERCPRLHAWIHERLALAYKADGNTEKAIATYEEIIRRNPDAYAIKIDLAKLFHKTDPEKAKAIYEQLILEDPENPEFSMAFARFYRDTGNQNMQIFYLEGLIQKGKRVTDALLQLVPLYEQENRKDDIRRICKLARQKLPESSILEMEIYFIERRNGITE